MIPGMWELVCVCKRLQPHPGLNLDIGAAGYRNVPIKEHTEHMGRIVTCLCALDFDDLFAKVANTSSKDATKNIAVRWGYRANRTY